MASGARNCHPEAEAKCRGGLDLCIEGGVTVINVSCRADGLQIDARLQLLLKAAISSCIG